ncbi:MAG: orotidine-5'-phosphate decarboxylase [Ktedonobacterales bacterium]
MAVAHQTFMERLRSRWRDAQTLLCVGLDGELERLPPSVLGGQTGFLSLDDERAGSGVEGSLVTFHQAIIDATADLVCAFKLNSAFFEAHGPAGLRALIRLIAYIHARYPLVPVLLDAKRGDISSTSTAYARAAFDVCDADAITLQPYLGGEALAPFLERCERGIFILCRSSNPGSAELQDLPVRLPDGTGDVPLYIALARRVADDWNVNSNCGLVVGATYPSDLAEVRAVVGDLPILVPGIGTQGGDLEATLRAGLDSQGNGLVISASRSIIYASSDLDFAQAARRQAKRLSREINRLRETSK